MGLGVTNERNLGASGKGRFILVVLTPAGSLLGQLPLQLTRLQEIPRRSAQLFAFLASPTSRRYR